MNPLKLIFTLALLLLGNAVFAACVAPTCTKVIDNGSDANKKVLVVLGDGYASGDQTKYNDDVKAQIIDGVFGHDFYLENQNAFNVYRINLVSVDSGVSQKVYNENGTPTDASDDTVTSTTLKNTALKYIFSGSWAHCWLEGSADTGTLVNNAINASVSKYDYVAVILNEDAFGGCGGGGFQVVPRGVSWPVMAHEFGHGIGALWDEYFNGGTSYSGGATNQRNCSTESNRNNVVWNRFIAPGTAVPTSAGAGIDSNKTVGIFPGCGTKATGINRPVDNCRMRGNSPDFCPVCNTLMRKSLKPETDFNFDKAVSGDFTGDGRADLVVHRKQDLQLYRKNDSKHELHWQWVANNIIPAAPGGSTWQPAANDKYYVGDFNGDGKKDLAVFNGSDWIMPYLALLVSDGNGFRGAARYDNTIGGFWTMKSSDEFYVADFNADGKDDLIIRNGKQWSMPYIGMLRSNGNSLSGVRRYDGSLPGWIMRGNDKVHVGDFDNDNKDDIYIFNGKNWGPKYLGMIKADNASLTRIKLYADTLPGWTMKEGDQFYVADYDGDGRKDLYVFNKDNWSWAYLLMARSTGTALSFSKRYDNSSAANNIPGWSMQKGDRFWVSDANKDGRGDLFVFNPAVNWSTEYLGTLRSNGNSLSGSWSEDWIGGWNLGSVDKLLVANYEGGAGEADIYIRNSNWLGLLRRSAGGFAMDRIYQSWIYSPLHDSKPWSNDLP